MRALLVPLLVACAFVVPAQAAPSNTAITAVFECPTGSCGANANQLSSNEITRGLLRIDVKSDDNLGGLSLLRLEAIGPGDTDWSCIRQIGLGGTQHYQSSIEWVSSHWPFPGPASGCTEQQPHKHGEATLNGSFSLRVVATESGSNATQTSSPFALRLANPAQPPTWRGEPSVTGGSVTLRWYRNPEVDVIEYRVVRTDASGRKKVIAIDASAPAKTSGCEPEKEATFTCVDRPPAGRNRYVVQAFRASPGGDPRCTTHPEPCVGPASSTSKLVTIASSGSGPAPSATSDAAPPTSSSTPGAALPGATAHPTTSATGGDALGGPARANEARGGPLAAASIALAALLVAHVVTRTRGAVYRDGRPRGGR